MKKKPAAKKMPRKSGKVIMKEIDGRDTPTSTIHHNLTPEELKEKMDKATSVKAPWIKKSEEKEFGTPSSQKARYEESEWIPNPDLDRTTSKYSEMSKRELEIIGRKYGVEVDRRLRKHTIIRIVELAEEAFKKEQAMMEDPMHKKLLQAIFIGIGIGLAMGILFGYGIGIR